MGADKWHYEVTVKEGKALLPAVFEKMLAELKRSSGGDFDFPLLGVEVADLAGTVSREGDALVLTARGSGQKYRLKGLSDPARAPAVFAGRLTQEKGGDPVLELPDSKVPAK